jgi:hypothetical protein
MAVERAAGGSSLIDVLDRVLDKGIDRHIFEIFRSGEPVRARGAPGSRDASL